MMDTTISKIAFLSLVTLVATLALLMYSVDLFIQDEGCTLACLSTIQWIVLAIIVMGGAGCAALLVLSPKYSHHVDLERYSQSVVWRIFLVVCLLAVILGLNFFLFPSYQPGMGFATNYLVIYEFFTPLAAMAIVYGVSGMVALLILKFIPQAPAQWTFTTLTRVLLSLGAIVFVGEYLLSLLWGAFLYLR